MDEKELFLANLDEKVKEIEELWDDSFIHPDVVKKLVEGYKFHKRYDYGTFKEVSILVYKRDKKYLYVVRNNSTGVYKLVTENWKRAESLAKRLADRYRALNRLFGVW